MSIRSLKVVIILLVIIMVHVFMHVSSGSGPSPQLHVMNVSMAGASPINAFIRKTSWKLDERQPSGELMKSGGNILDILIPEKSKLEELEGYVLCVMAEFILHGELCRQKFSVFGWLSFKLIVPLEVISEELCYDRPIPGVDSDDATANTGTPEMPDQIAVNPRNR
jgi:hypothetical protein